MKTLSIPFCLLIAACSSPAEEPAAETGEQTVANAQEAAEPVAEVPSLQGQWSVESIDARPLTQAYDMGATVTGDTFTIASDCVRLGWAYTQQRNIVTFTDKPVVSCERGHTTNEEEVERVIGLANIAMFSDDGGQVELSGSGGRVTLTRR